MVYATHEILKKIGHTNIYLMTDWQEVKKFMQLLIQSEIASQVRA